MVVLGVVLGPPIPSPLAPTGPRQALVRLEDQRLVDARVANLGQGAGKGVFAPPLPGDEVLVFLPDGATENATILGSLAGAKTPMPVAATPSLHIVVMHPLGVELRSADGLPANGIVMATLLPDLLAAFQAIVTFATALQTVTSPATLAAIAPAATALLADPNVIAFLAALGTSSVPNTAVPPGTGGPPYASILNRVTS